MPGYFSSPTVAIDRAALDDREHRGRPGAVVDAGAASADAWTIFWQEQGTSRCCAHAPAGMREALASHWRAFALALPPAAHILDIGCGTGAVGHELIACQASLRITGIDFARIPPSDQPRITIMTATPMESLPFARSSFDAAVSQFGYEYGRSGEAAREVARVLIPGAPVSLLVHHSQSPIVADCRSHQTALTHLTSASLERAFMSGDSVALVRQLSHVRAACPGERIVEQAIRGLGLRIHASQAERALVWRAVVDALAPERIMLAALEASCVAPDELTSWLEPLAEWFELTLPTTLAMRKDTPLAWSIQGRRL